MSLRQQLQRSSEAEALLAQQCSAGARLPGWCVASHEAQGDRGNLVNPFMCVTHLEVEAYPLAGVALASVGRETEGML